jgi:long-chain acyl-CoA synthetase
VCGSIGTPRGDQEIRLAPDGEILVRGANVSAEYYGQQSDSSTRVEQGWLHTDDLGEIDAAGRLFYRGRKRDLIVRSDGMNVYPFDVEVALNQRPGVVESVVLGIGPDANSVVHAAVVLADEAPPAQEITAAANLRLEPY